MRSPLEEWADVPGYEGTYWISTHARLYSRKREGTSGGFITPRPNHHGYASTTIQIHNKEQRIRLHVLALRVFVGPRPSGMVSRHLNGDRMDWRMVNLAYGTPAENSQDTIDHGHNFQLNKTHCPKGHPYDEQNTIQHGKGSQSKRYCRICTGRRRKQSYRRNVEDTLQLLTMTNQWQALMADRSATAQAIREALTDAAERKAKAEQELQDANTEFQNVVADAATAGFLPIVAVAAAAQVSRGRVYQILAQQSSEKTGS